VSAHLGAVVIFDETLYRPGHLVNRWMNLLCVHFEEHAKALAPKRTGDLAAQITSEAHQAGPKQMSGTIASNAPYTMYVLRGTTGPIYTTLGYASGGNIEAAFDPVTGKRLSGHWLHVAPGSGFPGFITHSVHGQAANNFLVKAWRRTARNHKSLRGFVSESIQF
jgi:hypothetical protein